MKDIVVAIDVIKSNGGIYNTRYIEFNNLKTGDSQSKPSNAEPRGVKVQYHIVKIIGSELTNGQEISSR